MKKFFNRNGRVIIRMYLNQLITSIFAIMVLSASSNNNVMLFCSSILSVIIYMILTYNLFWTHGAKQSLKKPKLENKNVIKTSVLIVLMGSVYNILCAVVYSILKLYILFNNIISNNTGDTTVLYGNIFWNIMKLTNAAYTGFEALLYPNPNYGLPVEQATLDFPPLLTPPYFYFVTLVVIFAVGMVSYYLGYNEISLAHRLGFKSKIKVESDIKYNGFGDK